MISVMFHLYILESEKNKKYYIGSTANLQDRFLRHNSGRSKVTLSEIPWKIVWTEEYTTRSEAIKRELEIKSLKSHTRISKMINGSNQNVQ